MPPIPPTGALLAYFFSTIIAYVLVIKDATDDASIKAVLTTLAGSITPLSIRLVNYPFEASNPHYSLVDSLTF
jgi:hypothetical protein